jgi:hypothetical protein
MFVLFEQQTKNNEIADKSASIESHNRIRKCGPDLGGVGGWGEIGAVLSGENGPGLY